ncbi:hypothetical protein [Coleofasciculus sp. FACHB-129]|uniref:hypothetical protein n=1 Tax=Cyanophyceae TaxID=3028117 RepID=UPI00168459AD|nr:hypothetical protein [Coleofasciculus sp. FACHB-129]
MQLASWKQTLRTPIPRWQRFQHPQLLARFSQMLSPTVLLGHEHNRRQEHGQIQQQYCGVSERASAAPSPDPTPTITATLKRFNQF